MHSETRGVRVPFLLSAWSSSSIVRTGYVSPVFFHFFAFSSAGITSSLDLLSRPFLSSLLSLFLSLALYIYPVRCSRIVI